MSLTPVHDIKVPSQMPEPIPTPQQSTQFHLAAVSFVYPPSPWTLRQCVCGKHVAERPEKLSQHIRLYYAEPSYYAHTPGCFLIKENRFIDGKGWHAPSDGLVADDAVAGSPIAAVGWWHASHDGTRFQDIYETRVYYVDANGHIRERINHTHFDPTPRDDFDTDLPKPEDLVPPTPGWRLTPLSSKLLDKESTSESFPEITPHPVTKIAAVRSDKGEIYIFYQEQDLSVRGLVLVPGKGWARRETPILGSEEVQAGAALAAVVGGWSEVRLYYITRQSTIGEVYQPDGGKWTRSELPLYTVLPTSMIATVAWNFATPLFQIRLYATGGKGEVLEYSFSRQTGGWTTGENDYSSFSQADNLSAALYPVSAVAAVLVGDGCLSKVYFHPRRFVAEWDTRAHVTTPSTITTVSERFSVRREIEQATRVKIAEEEERKRREAEEKEKERLRLEAEAKRRKEEEDARKREEAARKQREAEEERKRQQEEQARKAAAPPPLSEKDNRLKEVLKATPVGKAVTVPQGEVARRLQKKTGCEAGFEWLKTTTGWICAGKGHNLTDKEFAEIFGG
ncbi:hypothetical protein NPX13_g6515 [Xylaria arbuscula]|uniref:Fucose-specific lectin n=1 Tax=Xylaria arbuscula TaxID=114810 RepID=A0A9W8TK20_9PEZI|nr:hypothetical protein NPX13_g6515 [Xylaria arbuscula]